MTKNIENLFESNWDEVKGNIKSQWGKLTHNDIKQVEGSYDILIAKLKKAYGYTREEIEEEVDKFLSSEGVEEVKNQIKNIKEGIQDNVYSIKDTVEEYVHRYLQDLKDKTIKLEKNIVNYAMDNPMKILGTAAVISFALTKILSAKK